MRLIWSIAEISPTLFDRRMTAEEGSSFTDVHVVETEVDSFSRSSDRITSL